MGERVGDALGSSPHTRGAPGADRSREPARRIIPAYAGSTAALGEEKRLLRDHPRIRGEHRCGASGPSATAGSSPHTRGAPSRPWRRRGFPGIIPAYAGSTAQHAGVEFSGEDHPRIRGEHIGAAAHQIKITGSSPHTRGAHQRRFQMADQQRIIPAYAGSTGGADGDVPVTEWIIPAYAGSTTRRLSRRGTCSGSSPHTRGALRPLLSVPRRPVDHPRIRGEHQRAAQPAGELHGIIPAYAGSTAETSVYSFSHSGSSPHTRGALGSGAAGCSVSGIIPAYAGSTTGTCPPGTGSTDHPRIRGEHSIAKLGEEKRLRIIPAYAGSTSPRRRWFRARRDHPRIRGEH